MTASAYFHSRAGSLLAGPAVKLKPLRFSKSAVGGPKRAEIRADGGSLVDLYDLLAYLGRGMRIQMEGQNAWWGFLDEVRIYDGLTETVVSLERMYNRVATAYELTTAGSERSTRATSDWVEDTLSGAQYGWKELLATSRANNATHAATDAARLLELHKAPPALLMAAGSRTEKPYATLVCSGWWKTLGWRYASVPLLLAMQYPTIGLEDLAIGAGGAQRVAQVFDVGPASINAAAVEVYVRKVGSPVDNLVISILENPDDATPGASLVSANVSGALLGASYAWTRVSFSSAENLAADGTYFLQASRSGGVDAVNYYELRMDTLEGYAGGPCLTYDGAWSSHAADMPFRIFADAIVETSQQILSLLTGYGQFLARPVVEQASGVDLESYRDGDSTALSEIEHLMEIGTSSGRRYLAEVNESLHLRVFEEPVETASPYTIDKELRVFDGTGAPVEGWRAPVGVYLRSRSSAIGILNRLAGINLTMFVEEMEYDIESHGLRMTPRGAPKPEDELLRVANG